MIKEEAMKKEMQEETLMDDELLGEEGDEEDETYEESENEEDSDDEMSDEDFDEDIAIEELELLGPVQPFSHDDCIEGQCKAGKKQDFRKVEQDFGMYRSHRFPYALAASCISHYGNTSLSPSSEFC